MVLLSAILKIGRFARFICLFLSLPDSSLRPITSQNGYSHCLSLLIFSGAAKWLVALAGPFSEASLPILALSSEVLSLFAHQDLTLHTSSPVWSPLKECHACIQIFSSSDTSAGWYRLQATHRQILHIICNGLKYWWIYWKLPNCQIWKPTNSSRYTVAHQT